MLLIVIFMNLMYAEKSLWRLLLDNFLFLKYKTKAGVSRILLSFQCF